MSIEKFQKALDTLWEKQSQFEIDLALAVDSNAKFALKKQIEECEDSRKRIERAVSEFSKKESFLDLPTDVSLEEGSDLLERSNPQAVLQAEDTSGGLEDPYSAHLAIAVFLQGEDDQKIYLQHRLFYYDAGDIVSIKLVVPQEPDALPIKQFPAMLKVLSEAAAIHLSQHLAQSFEPWELTIALFVPLELLCLPISRWCGPHADLWKDYPIVLGCSDRFHPMRPGDAARLLNKMTRGWRRFQRSIPDEDREPLKKLRWLDSDRAAEESFESYAGFQCFGTCLKPDQTALNSWQELVESGIPLALWVCGGQSERAAVEPTFRRIVEYTRFEFLEEVRIIRAEQQKRGQNLVGVFYEDPNYAIKLSQGLFEMPKQRPDPSGRGG